MAIDSIIANASARVAGAIRDAARSTGASFEYLLTAARMESNLNPAAQATTSSAKGLYQFIDQTWLATLKNAGPAHGYGQYADAITLNADGRYEVADPNQRAAIMRLRNDPAASATMAGAFTQTNAAQLAAALGRQPSEGELYIAHFLGSDGAAKLIDAAASQPGANARRAVSASGGGEPEHIPEQIRPAAQRERGLCHADRPLRDCARHRVCARPARQPDGASRFTRHRRRHAGFRASQYRAARNAGAGPGGAAEARPFFQSMFTDRGNRAVTQTVSNLWTPAKSDAPAAPSLMLNLFSDPPAGARKPAGGKI